MLLLWKLALVASELYLHMVMNDMRHAGHIMQTLGARLRVVMGMTSVRVLQAVTSLLMKQDCLLLLSLFQTRQTNSGLVSSFRPWPSRCESLVAIQVLITNPLSRTVVEMTATDLDWRLRQQERSLGPVVDLTSAHGTPVTPGKQAILRPGARSYNLAD